jgi:ABC-2 type transport system permease protein
MNPGRINAVIWRQAYELRRNPNQITNMIYWPIINIAVWGFFTLYLAHGDYLRPTLLNALLGGAILWGLFNGFQRDLALGFLEELWARNMVNLFASPLSIAEYVNGLVVVNVLKTVVSVTIMSLITLFFYHYDIGPDFTLLAPFMLVLGLAAIALGLVVTALIFRYTTKVQGVAWSVAGVLMPVSCVFYPLHSLGPKLQAIAWMLPTTHAFEGMRQAITAGTFSLRHLAWGLGLDAAYLLLAALSFQRLFAAARRHGLLVKIG